MRRWQVWVSLPAFVSLVLALLINAFSLYNPVFYMRASLSVLLFLVGLLVTLTLFVMVRWWGRERQALAAAQAAMADERRRFLRRLDHELKNPLTAVRTGLANVLDAPTEGARQEALETVQAQTLRLSRLTADLRKIAELETRPLEHASLDLTTLLAEVVEAAEDLAETAGRQVRLTVPQAPWPLPVVQGDRDLLFLAVYNLLDNALKYTQPGDTIELRAREDGRVVIVEVADTGPGIPNEEMPHVWNELYRGQCANGVPGSGLGLPLVKAIIERHKGQVNLHSRAGQGTLVTLHLPVIPAR